MRKSHIRVGTQEAYACIQSAMMAQKERGSRDTIVRALPCLKLMKYMCVKVELRPCGEQKKKMVWRRGLTTGSSGAEHFRIADTAATATVPEKQAFQPQSHQLAEPRNPWRKHMNLPRFMADKPSHF